MKKISWNDYKTYLGSVLRILPPKIISSPQPSDILTDSRQSLTNKWFLPLVGENFDGHHFIEEALLKKDAVGAFCNESYFKKLPTSLIDKVVVVSDTLAFLQKTANMNRVINKHCKVFAVTGSVGKTTCKNMLKSIFKETKKPFLCAEKNYNNEFGLPFTLLNLKPEHCFAILEMGARKPGNIKELVEIAQPNYVACLYVGYSHIEIFGSRENIYLTKTEIFEKTPFYQKGIVNGNDTKLVSLTQERDPGCLTFGNKSHLDAEVIEVKNHKQSADVTLRLFDKKFTFNMENFHEAYAINSLAASLLAYTGGIDIETIKKGLSNFTASASRFEIHKHKNKFIIDDCYNASPESMEAGIKTVNKLYPGKTISYILGDMLELGDDSDRFHEDLGRLCSKKQNTYNLLAVGDKSKRTLSSAYEEGLLDQQGEHFQTVDKLIEKNLPLSYFGDVIYIKGSFGIQLARFLKYLLEK